MSTMPKPPAFHYLFWRIISQLGRLQNSSLAIDFVSYFQSHPLSWCENDKTSFFAHRQDLRSHEYFPAPIEIRPVFNFLSSLFMHACCCCCIWYHCLLFIIPVRRVAPRFSIPPDPHYEVMSGSSLNITCVAVGSPMPYVKWKKGEEDVNPEVTAPIGKNVLELSDIRETTTYTCVAASRWGVIESQTSVRVQTLPRSPENLKATEITPTSVKLSWSYPGSGSEVQYYVIEYRPKVATWDWKEISGAITQFYDIRGLSPYTEYEFVVLGVNNVGRGEKSVPIVVTTGNTGGSGEIESKFYWWSHSWLFCHFPEHGKKLFYLAWKKIVTLTFFWAKKTENIFLDLFHALKIFFRLFSHHEKIFFVFFLSMKKW